MGESLCILAQGDSAWDALDAKLRKHHAGGGRLEGIMHSGGHAADCMYSKSPWTHTVGGHMQA